MRARASRAGRGCGQLRREVLLERQGVRMALDTNAPFTWRQARDEGISQRSLESDRFRCLVTGVYVASESIGIGAARKQSELAYAEARAALLVAGPHAFLSHHTAARLYGAFVPDVPKLHASVAPGRRRSTHREVVVHQSRRVAVRHRGLAIVVLVGPSGTRPSPRFWRWSPPVLLESQPRTSR